MTWSACRWAGPTSLATSTAGATAAAATAAATAATAPAAGTAITTAAGAAAGVVYHKVCGRPLLDGDDAERTTASSIACTSHHLIDLVLGRVNGAGKTITAAVGAVDLHSPIGHLGSEGSSRLEINGIPPELDKGLSGAVDVGARDVRRPVPKGIGIGTPDTRLVSADTRRVDIVVGGCATPVIRIGHGKRRVVRHRGRDQHGFVARKHGLAKGDNASGVVLDPDIGRCRLAVWPVGKRFLNVAVCIAE